MSESTENTQPVKATQPVQTVPPSPTPEEAQESTQEIKPKPKNTLAGRIGRFFLNLLIFLVIIGLGVLGGYQSGIGIRQRAESDLVSQQLSDQFARALVDIQFQHYESAKTRLEYIIGIDPSFPGAMEKLTEVMVMTTIPTATPVVSPTPELIVDVTDYNGLFVQAQQLVNDKKWQDALTVLDTLRRKDSTFNVIQVDGMYYFSLRNLGVEMIQAGNLEGGIYQLALAERFAPLDNTAHILQDNARFYITAASFWELDWQLAAEYFAQLNGSGIWDGTMTATERYHIAAMRYGDQLYAEGRYCDAYEQYENAKAAGALDDVSIGLAHDAEQACFPPTEAATEEPQAQPTEEEPNNPPPVVTTEAPPQPTQPPATQPPATQPPPTDPPATQSP